MSHKIHEGTYGELSKNAQNEIENIDETRTGWSTIKAVQIWLDEWMSMKAEAFFCNGIHKLPHRWTKWVLKCVESEYTKYTNTNLLPLFLNNYVLSNN